MGTSTKLPVIPASIKCGRRGSCVPVALYCLPQLVDGRDFILEGYVTFLGGRRHEHTWMLIDGQIYDPSLVQFRRFKNYDAGPTRIVTKKTYPSDYRGLWSYLKSPWWRWRLLNFGLPGASWAMRL